MFVRYDTPQNTTVASNNITPTMSNFLIKDTHRQYNLYHQDTQVKSFHLHQSLSDMHDFIQQQYPNTPYCITRCVKQHIFSGDVIAYSYHDDPSRVTLMPRTSSGTTNIALRHVTDNIDTGQAMHQLFGDISRNIQHTFHDLAYRTNTQYYPTHITLQHYVTVESRHRIHYSCTLSPSQHGIELQVNATIFHGAIEFHEYKTNIFTLPYTHNIEDIHAQYTTHIVPLIEQNMQHLIEHFPTESQHSIVHILNNIHPYADVHASALLRDMYDPIAHCAMYYTPRP